jgi:hypothetical protein
MYLTETAESAKPQAQLMRRPALTKDVLAILHSLDPTKLCLFHSVYF